MNSALLILLLAISGANALTFTCQQVKKLIRDKTKFSTTDACISLDEYISTNGGFTTQVFFDDGSGKGRWSFAETATIGCVSSFSSMNSWTIVTDRPDGGEGIDCTFEFTVFFSSIQTNLVTAKSSGAHHQSYKAYNITVAAPRGGMLIDFSCKDTKEPLNFYTGLGNGASEDMYYYGSSLCDERLSVFAWDNAVTINVPNDGYIQLTYFGTGEYLSLGSVSYDFILMGSGKSNALTQHGDDDKFVWLSPTVSDDLKFHIDGSAEFDPTFGNSLRIASECKELNCTGSVNPIRGGDVHMILEADFLAINYYTFVPYDQWKDSDMFFIRISTTPLNSTDPPPTVPPPKPSTDYSCGCELSNGKAEFASSIWLDIAFIVDVSKAMGADGITKASSMIDSIVSSLTIGNTAPQSTQFSRVGIVAASDQAEVINGLSNAIPSPLKLTPGSSAEADIGIGIESALSLFKKSHRSSTRQLIYIIAASDSSNTSRFVNSPRSNQFYDATFDVEKFKSNGGIIAVTEADPALAVTWFSKLASPGYFNTKFNDNVNVDLQLLCDANCFCTSGLTAFTRDDNEKETALGGCYHSPSTTDPYVLAKEACQSEGAILSTVHDQDKQLFLMQVISIYGAKVPFWIGYEYNGKEWEWIDDSNSTYSAWNSAQPDPSKGRCAISQQTTGFNSGWFAEDCSDDHLYICELPPCSVDRFCS